MKKVREFQSMLKAFNVPCVPSTSFQKLIETITPNTVKETPQPRIIQRYQETNTWSPVATTFSGIVQEMSKNPCPRTYLSRGQFFKENSELPTKMASLIVFSMCACNHFGSSHQFVKNSKLFSTSQLSKTAAARFFKTS